MYRKRLLRGILEDESKRRKIKRVQLQPKDQSIVITGFGRLHGESRTGALVRRGPNSVDLRIDTGTIYGTIVDQFSVSSGVRIADLGADDGWRINPRDLNRYGSASTTDPRREGGRLLLKHRREVPMSSLAESWVCELWQNSKTRELFVQAYRKIEGPMPDDPYDSPKVKHRPGMVPLGYINRLIEEYKDK